MPNSAESDATPAMIQDTLPPFSLPSVQRKKVTAAFDGGRITSDGGVMLLGAFEASMGIASRLASLITDRRNPLLVTHSVADILRARMLAIACGYEDADDLEIQLPAVVQVVTRGDSNGDGPGDGARLGVKRGKVPHADPQTFVLVLGKGVRPVQSGQKRQGQEGFFHGAPF